jgi:hypothetical protein
MLSQDDIHWMGAFETFMHEGVGKILTPSNEKLEFFKPEGDMIQLIRGFRESDSQETAVELVGIMANKIEYRTEVVAGTTAELVKGTFHTEPTEQELSQLTQGTIEIELDGLFNENLGSSKDERKRIAIEVLNSDEILEREIEKTRAELDTIYDNRAHSNFVKNQAKQLGEFMVTGKAGYSTLTNSYIINGFVSILHNQELNKMHIIEYNEEGDAALKRAYIDKLATLYAIKHLDEEVRKTTAKFMQTDPDAIENILNYDILMREEFRNTENYEKEYDMNRVKGSHFKVDAGWISYKPGFKRDEDAHRDNEFEFVDDMTYNSDLAIYWNTDYTDPRWVSEGTITTNDAYDVKSYINAIKEREFDVERVFDPAYNKIVQERIKAELKEQEEKVLDEMVKLMEEDDYNPEQVSGLRPVFTVSYGGNMFLTDLDIAVDKIKFENQRQVNNTVHTVIGRSIARAANLNAAKQLNQKMLDLAEADMNKNYFPSSKYGKTNSMEYVKIGPNESNNLSREIWPVIPRYMKLDIIKRFNHVKRNQLSKIAKRYMIDEDDLYTEDVQNLESKLFELYQAEDINAKKIMFTQRKLSKLISDKLTSKLEKSKNNQYEDVREQVNKIIMQRPYIAVRRNLVYHYFGNREPYILDPSKFNKKLSFITKRLKKIDAVWRELVKIIKTNIVIRTTSVVMWNIISNVLLAVLQRRNPIAEIRDQIKGFRLLGKYLEAYREAEKIKIKQKAGNATAKDINRLNLLENEMQENPVKELIDAGLYTSAVEDINTPELHRKSFFDNALDQYIDKLPKGAQKAIDVLYVTKNTPIFHALLKITQASDFAARYAKYHQLRREGVNKQRAIKIVLDNQINYGFNHGKILQWLNAHGLVMFSMFFEKIQRVMKKTTLENPVNVAASIAMQGFVFEHSPISDMLFFKEIGYLAHTPLDIVENLVDDLATPPAFQLIKF